MIVYTNPGWNESLRRTVFYMENVVIFMCFIIYDGDINSIVIVNKLIHVLKIRKVIFVCEAQGRIGKKKCTLE